MTAIKRLMFRLRVEEAMALVFLLPTSYLTITASLHAQAAGILAPRHPGAVLRLVVAAAFLAALLLALRVWPDSRCVMAVREVVPFVTCFLIYTNLHDTIGLVNRRDVHHVLAGLDLELFGMQPSVWAERFVTRGRTEIMSFFYVSFFWIAPATSVLLLLRRRFAEFRAATMAILACFYLGYFLYVLFPAAPPRLVLVYEYSKSLEGYPRMFSALSAKAFELLPLDSRAAFPSLHAAVSLVCLVCAFRYTRIFFWLLLPFVCGLWISTIYLRHHYFVDLMAGWALAPLALTIAPRLDQWWAMKQLNLGHRTATGTEVRSKQPAGDAHSDSLPAGSFARRLEPLEPGASGTSSG